MLDIIEEFYEKHPILFQLITLPIEWFISITISFWIIKLFGY